MNIDDIISKADDIINNDNRDFETVSKIYPFTTEHIHNYLATDDINGKSILTVSASGDHILNLMALDAKNIHGFDINVLSSLYTELKTVAANELSYNEFITFFSNEYENCWNTEIYNSLKEKLSTLSLSFFNHLFKTN